MVGLDMPSEGVDKADDVKDNFIWFDEEEGDEDDSSDNFIDELDVRFGGVVRSASDLPA